DGIGLSFDHGPVESYGSSVSENGSGSGGSSPSTTKGVPVSEITMGTPKPFSAMVKVGAPFSTGATGVPSPFSAMTTGVPIIVSLAAVAASSGAERGAAQPSRRGQPLSR